MPDTQTVYQVPTGTTVQIPDGGRWLIVAHDGNRTAEVDQNADGMFRFAPGPAWLIASSGAQAANLPAPRGVSIPGQPATLAEVDARIAVHRRDMTESRRQISDLRQAGIRLALARGLSAQDARRWLIARGATDTEVVATLAAVVRENRARHRGASRV